MKKNIIYVLASCLFACTNAEIQDNKSELKDEINQLDKKIYTQFQNADLTGEFHLDKNLFRELIEKNKEYFTLYPEDSYSDTALNKIASIYLQLEEEDNATQWRDTILQLYPNTFRKEELLELQMNYYDFNQYSPEKIKEYAQKLLEIESLSEEKKEMIHFRLQNIDKTFEELILLQMEMETDTTD